MVGTQLRAVYFHLKGPIEELFQKLTPSIYDAKKLSNQPKPTSGNLLEPPEVYPDPKDVVLQAAKKAIKPYKGEITIDPKNMILVVVPENPEDTDEIIHQVKTSTYNEIFDPKEGAHPNLVKELEEHYRESMPMWS